MEGQLVTDSEDSKVQLASGMQDVQIRYRVDWYQEFTQRRFVLGMVNNDGQFALMDTTGTYCQGQGQPGKSITGIEPCPGLPWWMVLPPW